MVSSSISILQIGQVLSAGFLNGLEECPVSMANLWLLSRSFVRAILSVSYVSRSPPPSPQVRTAATKARALPQGLCYL